MHEMGIVMQIIDITKASIPEDIENAVVEKVNLRVGKLSGVVPENLQFCFEAAVKDSSLANARLNIEEVPIIAQCSDCGFEWTIHEPVFRCTRCNSGNINVISGKELEISSIEIAD